MLKADKSREGFPYRLNNARGVKESGKSTGTTQAAKQEYVRRRRRVSFHAEFPRWLIQTSGERETVFQQHRKGQRRERGTSPLVREKTVGEALFESRNVSRVGGLVQEQDVRRRPKGGNVADPGSGKPCSSRVS